jgi:tetratricopeptide (TPR) repeat protein
VGSSPASYLLVLALAAAGCAGHADRTLAARSALDAGSPTQALAALNDELDVERAEELPAKVGGDSALLLLDRAMVLQQLGQYKLSSRDLEVSDKQIEVLDLSQSAAADIGRYLFSDDVGPYKAPAYEKLMINTMNMVNYLVRGDLNGARIEARRLAVMQDFLARTEGPGRALLGPGSYLAGFTFEKSGRPEEALRYYDEALGYGSYRTLVEPVRRLSARSSYSSPRLRALTGKEPATGEEPATGAEAAPARSTEDAELLVIVSFGRVPAKVAKRIPIGLALTYVSGAMSPHDIDRANYLAAQGLVTWINYPELGRPRGNYDAPWFALDGAYLPLEGILAVDREAARAWEQAKGAVVASAITRMIARVAAGEGVRRAAGEGLAGALLSLGTQATLTAVDTPDTRSWATLPARMAFGRVRLPAGTHWVDVGARGAKKRQAVTLKPGGWAVVNLTALN